MIYVWIGIGILSFAVLAYERIVNIDHTPAVPMPKSFCWLNDD